MIGPVQHFPRYRSLLEDMQRSAPARAPLRAAGRSLFGVVHAARTAVGRLAGDDIGTETAVRDALGAVLPMLDKANERIREFEAQCRVPLASPRSCAWPLRRALADRSPLCAAETPELQCRAHTLHAAILIAAGGVRCGHGLRHRRDCGYRQVSSIALRVVDRGDYEISQPHRRVLHEGWLRSAARVRAVSAPTAWRPIVTPAR